MSSSRIRPHHGMCLAYFVGHGYSDSFTGHMGAVLASMRPDTEITLVTDTDQICAACPHNRDGRCETAALVAEYDRAVLERCGLRDGQTLPFGAFTELVQTRILAPGHRSSICGRCQWNDICQSGTSRWA